MSDEDVHALYEVARYHRKSARLWMGIAIVSWLILLIVRFG